jgi:7-cyano-7-deazaguanine synthase
VDSVLSDRIAGIVGLAGADAPIGVLASGGLDSCVLLAQLLDRGLTVQPFYIRSDLCWHREEEAALADFLRAIGQPRLTSLVALEMPMADLYGDHWSVTSHGTPQAGSVEEEVYLPGRNALLSIKAALWCQLHGVPVLALASLRSNPFADTTESFLDSFQRSINLPGTPEVHLVTPLAGITKQEVMWLGRDYPLSLTFSCIAPVGGQHCGRCNKCGERRLAFQTAGFEDRSLYASEDQAGAML